MTLQSTNCSPTAQLKPGEINLGTTIMAVQFAGGVVMGADSRTTTGAYIANRVSDKITCIHDKIYCCRSGSSADTQAIADVISYYVKSHENETQSAPKVSTAAKMFKQICYQNKNFLLAGIIVAGWDEKEGASVWNIPLGGSLHKQAFAIGGSGSTYIFGYCDSKYREGMSKEECVEFVTNAIALAISRDGSSGGVIRLAIIDENGVERRIVAGNAIPKFWES